MMNHVHVETVWDVIEVGANAVLCLVGSELRSLKRGNHVKDECEALSSVVEGWGRCFGWFDGAIVLPHYPRGPVAPASLPESAKRKTASVVARAMMNERAAAFIGLLGWQHVYLVGEEGWQVEMSTLGVSTKSEERVSMEKNLDVFRGMLRDLGLADVVPIKSSWVEYWDFLAENKNKPVQKSFLAAPSASAAPARPVVSQSPEERVQALAMEGGDLKELLALIGDDRALIRRAVRGSAKGDHRQLLNALLEKWTDEADNAVNAAASAGRSELVVYLLESKRADANRAVIGAAFSGFSQLVEILLVKHGALLSWAVDGAARGGKKDLVFSLIARGAIEAEREELFEGALQSCASAQHVTLTKALLEQHKGKIDSALYGAAYGNREELVDWLLSLHEGTADVQSAIDGAEKGGHAQLANRLKNQQKTQAKKN